MSCFRRFLPILCIALLTNCPSALWAQAVAAKPSARPVDAVAKSPLTIEDILQTEQAKSWQFSPDGRWIVWVKETPNKDRGEVVDHLMLTDRNDGKEIQLTRGEHGCHSPRWSPNGERLAFLSDRPSPESKHEDDEAHTGIWLMDPHGGEAWLLLTGPRDVRDLAWLDEDTLVFLAQEKPAFHEIERKEEKDDSIVVDDEALEPAVRLFQVAVQDKQPIRLTDNKDRITLLRVSPDGQQAVTVHERSLSYAYDHKIRPAVFWHDLKSGEQKELFTDAKFHIKAIHWRPDSKGFYAISDYTSHPRYVHAVVEHLYYFDRTQKQPVQVPLEWQRGLANGTDGFAALPDGFAALLADGVRHKAARYTLSGKDWQRGWLQGEHADALANLAASPDGKTLLYLYSKAAGPRQWYAARLQQDQVQQPQPIFVLAPNLQDRRLAKTEIVHWTGALNENVEGILYYPLDYQAGQRYPLVVQIHGGPAGADFDVFDNSWSYPPNLLCSRGAFVLQPNYHGSTHYGLKWAESIANGKYYELPVVDIETGVDALVARGLVDGNRIGLSGWSNGAILTMALLTRRQYQAASAGAGGSEWVADWGACEFGLTFSNYYLGKSPLEDPELYIKKSPFYQFAKIRTPTLLFQGKEDRVVPVHHGWLQFRALQQLNKTTVRFILFPGEEHALTKRIHQKRKMTEELAWFDRYLFHTAPSNNLALKEDSLLAAALIRHQAQHQGRRFGVKHKEILLPETVVCDGLLIGRFEVTRAQYAQFDKKYAIEPGTENYPANGITAEQAQAYCTWLRQQTGQPYRLGTWAEMADLYETGEREENTLDRWAGYTITPEDRERLQPLLRQLPGPAPLLQEVGRRLPYKAETPLFDLGGNVAEWVVTPQGVRALGGSAERGREEREQQPVPAYIGFRVVKGQPVQN